VFAGRTQQGMVEAVGGQEDVKSLAATEFLNLKEPPVVPQQCVVASRDAVPERPAPFGAGWRRPVSGQRGPTQQTHSGVFLGV
jgi:hypothetical protein